MYKDLGKIINAQFDTGLEINFFVREPAGDIWEKFGRLTNTKKAFINSCTVFDHCYLRVIDDGHCGVIFQTIQFSPAIKIEHHYTHLSTTKGNDQMNTKLNSRTTCC